MPGGVHGANAEDDVVLGDGEFKGESRAGAGGHGPEGLVGGSPDDLVGGACGCAGGGLPG
jgi:hypothetical protein